MKKVLKILTSIFAVFILAVLAVFAINATDEKQTELTQQMLQKFPAQDGFALKDFKTSTVEKAPSIQFDKYSDYIASPEKFDELLSKHPKTLELLEKAFQQGQVAVNPDDNFYDGIHFYRPNDHRIFLISLSQQIKRGEVNQALSRLAESNHFLVSIAGSPQTFISELITLNLLNKNAEFVKELKDQGLAKRIPPELKESFYLTTTPNKIWDQCSRREFQLVSTVVLGPLDDIRMFETTSIFNDGTDMKVRALDKITAWFYTKLIRRNETLNAMSETFVMAASPACKDAASKECAESFERVTNFTATNFFVNPVGRGFIKLFVPRYSSQVITKIKASTERLNKTVAEI